MSDNIFLFRAYLELIALHWIAVYMYSGLVASLLIGVDR